MVAKDKKNRVHINTLLCKGCTYCMESCPKKVLQQGEELNKAGYACMTAPNEDLCIACMNCMRICPDFAIEISEA